MTKELIFNGVDLSRFFRITDIIRPIGNQRSISVDDAPELGVNIQQVKIGPKEHTVKFDMKTDDPMEMERLKHELAGVLNVSAPVKIMYGDEPDKYYLGMPIDDITPDNLTRWFQRSEFKLIIPDGVSHSTTYRSFDDGTVLDDKIVFNVVNNGNVPAFPIITIKHNSENGYIGLVNPSGSIEIGNIEEADTENVQLSERLLDYSKDVRNIPYTLNAGIYNDNAWRQTGEIGGVVRDGRNFLHMSKINSKTGQNCASMSIAIPADSSETLGGLHDYLWWRMAFELRANEKGIFKLTVSDTEGRFMYGMQAVKHSNGWDATYNLLVDQNGSTVAATRKFKTTNKLNENPLCLKRGTIDLKRNDDKIRYYWDGSYREVIVPALKGRKSATIHVMFGSFGNSRYANINYLGEFYYRKDFVSLTRDIPNKYPIGSTMVVNSENDTVTLDGLEINGDIAGEPHFLTIPPRESTLECYLSSFVRKKPTISLEFEERNL